MEPPPQTARLIWSLAFSEHPGEALRSRISAALDQARSVPHPRADYYWREQGLSVYAFESPCEGPAADVLERCRREGALLGPRWTIAPVRDSGAISGYLETTETALIPTLVWASFEWPG
jgi:hypothetical protein